MSDSSKMYPNGFHPAKIDRNRNFKGTAKAYTRTQRPPRYFLIDFGLSRQYVSRDAMDEPLPGEDKSAPEHRSKRRCNPFHTDIYYIGNLVRQDFMKVGIIRLLLSSSMISFSFTEVQRFRIYGGFSYLDDPRQPDRAPFYRTRVAGIFSYPRILEQEYASFKASLGVPRSATDTRDAMVIVVWRAWSFVTFKERTISVYQCIMNTRYTCRIMDAFGSGVDDGLINM